MYFLSRRHYPPPHVHGCKGSLSGSNLGPGLRSRADQLESRWITGDPGRSGRAAENIPFCVMIYALLLIGKGVPPLASSYNPNQSGCFA